MESNKKYKILKIRILKIKIFELGWFYLLNKIKTFVLINNNKLYDNILQQAQNYRNINNLIKPNLTKTKKKLEYYKHFKTVI